MDHKIYKAFFAPFTESRTTYHYNLPCHNLVCLEKLNEISLNSYLENDLDAMPMDHLHSFPFFNSFKYDTDSCSVLYPGHSLTDKAYDFVFKKILWQKRLACCIPKNYSKGLKKLKKSQLLKTHKMDKKTNIYLNLIKSAPNENFVGNYNWLYTGGNIVGFNYYNNYWLVTPDEDEESVFLNIIKLDSTFIPIWKENMKPQKFHLHENQSVYQIVCKTKSDAVFFSVRQREHITLKKLSDDCNMKEMWSYTTQQTTSKEKYLTCCDLSHDTRYLSTVKNNYQITIYDVEMVTSVSSFLESDNTMPWSRVLFNREGNGIYFADQNSFKIFDFRADFQPIFTYKPTALINRCEKITNFFGSESRENIIYMTTSHNMTELDIRNGKSIQRWTHMMKFPAQFGGTSRKEDKELVILQSEDSRELVGICNEGLLDDFAFSKSGPYLFTTTHEELVNAHFNGCGLHHKIEERLDFKITGLHVVSDSKGTINVCTVNGGGDVVMTKLKDRKGDAAESGKDYKISSNSKEGFKNFERHCYRVQTERKEIAPSKMYDITRVLSAWENPNNKVLLNKKSCPKISNFWPRFEMYSRESLYRCNDYLTEKILPHWGVKMKEDEGPDGKKQEKAEKLKEAKTKVAEWMTKNADM